MNQDRLINTQPRPRVLVRGFQDQSDFVQKLLKVAETTRHISSLKEVRQEEWDVLITDESIQEEIWMNPGRRDRVDVAPHMFAIFIIRKKNSANWFEVEDHDKWASSIQIKAGHICQELRRCSGLPPTVRDLVHEQLESALVRRKSHSVIRYREVPRASTAAMLANNSFPSPPKASPQIESFIETADGYALAGRYQRSSEADVWVLPYDIPDFIPWVKAAFTEWHYKCPDRFPGLPDWSQDPRWLTVNEDHYKKEIEKLSQERAAAIADFDLRDSVLRAEFAEAKADADAYERALLTQQSDPLKKAVQRAFKELGFTVVDADDENLEGDHLEDLRIEDPACPGWVCLAEVKGYSKGAQTGAIAQFIRFQARYLARTGKPADALWYIVNQFKDRDPSTRQPVLNGKDEDVAAFSLSSGLVIDTVELFKELQKVDKGKVEPTEVRRRLREARGRFRA